ncbi:unnamed protein product [Urochloa decumbens]|uniref:non-specific serine/threonine protein kinase n=1 Tax=Urochloa decumbens TaxID=240449 RepID=A0ABC9G685_9POAL
MAAATSSPFTFLCLYCFFMLCIHVPCASSTSFSFNFSATTNNPCGNALKCTGDSSFANSVIELTKNDGTRASDSSQGRVWYANPVPLWDASTGELASFRSVFSFRITSSADKDYNYNIGDGMAFFLASYSDGSNVLGSNVTAGGNLGLFNDTDHFNATGDSRVVAVEFDTYPNDWDDIKSQHIGIDVNSIRSVNSTGMKFPQDKNTSDLGMTATVQYDNKTKLLAVDLEIDGAPYQVSTIVDLKSCLPEQVAVGFSAATGLSTELHQVQAWSFSSTLEIAPEITSEPSAKLVIKMLVPVLAVSVFGIVGLLLWLKRRRNVKPNEATNDSESDEQQGEAEFEKGVAGPRRYSYRELAAATGDFAEENMLGRGGFGRVYKGRLLDDVDEGQLVAIKKFSPESSQSRKEFEAEVKIIGRLRHRNLVQLLGWCDSRKGLLLVYELVPEGSLDKHIYNTERVLTWAERYNIIVGLGSALRYLHRDWEQCVVHGDIKPSNIMLDSSYNAKLGDFGLARLHDHGTGPKTTVVKGTMGYIDPEFVNTSRRCTQSDVYSFGIVLLEIVSGRPPVDRWDPSFMLMKWVCSLYCQGKTLDAADARIRMDGDEVAERQMERALVVGLWCSLREPEHRPSVADALYVLQSEDKLPELPLQMYMMLAAPSFAVGEGGTSGSSFSSGVDRSSATTGMAHTSESSVN